MNNEMMKETYTKPEAQVICLEDNTDIICGSPSLFNANNPFELSLYGIDYK